MGGARASSPLSLARLIAGRYGRHLEVEAVALGGSQAAGTAEPGSDIDLYVYLREDLPVLVVGLDDQRGLDRMFALGPAKPGEGNLKHGWAERTLERMPARTLVLFGDDGAAAFFLVAAGEEAGSDEEAGPDVTALGERVRDALGARGGGKGRRFQGRGPETQKIENARRAIEGG